MSEGREKKNLRAALHSEVSLDSDILRQVSSERFLPIFALDIFRFVSSVCFLPFCAFDIFWRLSSECRLPRKPLVGGLPYIGFFSPFFISDIF